MNYSQFVHTTVLLLLCMKCVSVDPTEGLSRKQLALQKFRSKKTGSGKFVVADAAGKHHHVEATNFIQTSERQFDIHNAHQSGKQHVGENDKVDPAQLAKRSKVTLKLYVRQIFHMLDEKCLESLLDTLGDLNNGIPMPAKDYRKEIERKHVTNGRPALPRDLDDTLTQVLAVFFKGIRENEQCAAVTGQLKDPEEIALFDSIAGLYKNAYPKAYMLELYKSASVLTSAHKSLLTKLEEDLESNQNKLSQLKGDLESKNELQAQFTRDHGSKTLLKAKLGEALTHHEKVEKELPKLEQNLPDFGQQGDVMPVEEWNDLMAKNQMATESIAALNSAHQSLLAKLQKDHDANEMALKELEEKIRENGEAIKRLENEIATTEQLVGTLAEIVTNQKSFEGLTGLKKILHDLDQAHDNGHIKQLFDEMPKSLPGTDQINHLNEKANCGEALNNYKAEEKKFLESLVEIQKSEKLID